MPNGISENFGPWDPAKVAAGPHQHAICGSDERPLASRRQREESAHSGAVTEMRRDRRGPPELFRRRLRQDPVDDLAWRQWIPFGGLEPSVQSPHRHGHRGRADHAGDSAEQDMVRNIAASRLSRRCRAHAPGYGFCSVSGACATLAVDEEPGLSSAGAGPDAPIGITGFGVWPVRCPFGGNTSIFGSWSLRVFSSSWFAMTRFLRLATTVTGQGRAEFRFRLPRLSEIRRSVEHA
jgi:hypothetical protein